MSFGIFCFLCCHQNISVEGIDAPAHNTEMRTSRTKPWVGCKMSSGIIMYVLYNIYISTSYLLLHLYAMLHSTMRTNKARSVSNHQQWVVSANT